MKNLFLIALVVFIVGSGYFYMKQTPPTNPAPPATPTAVLEMSDQTEQTFNIKGLNFSFDVKEIKVKKGDKVVINFTNTEGFHDLKIDEFGVATKQIKTGESDKISFTADKTGTFEYYCSVGQHRQNGMWGKLIVE
ncbi:MAG: cupredoxin domain-containing protein [Candidatus Shapirobacteria bacterium]|jgi:plastocyanin